MSKTTETAASHSGLIGIYVRAKGALSAIGWNWLALPMRIAAFEVFWRSGQVKLADWDSTVGLFRDEYKVPALPPEIAAYMATTIELGCSTLILIGLATRFAALAVVGMILVIQTFVYPMAWPDHVQWLAFLIPILAWGPGRFSLDRLVGRAVGIG
jgi:putative oxidoreductase